MKDYQPTLEDAIQQLTEDGVDIAAFLLRVQTIIDKRSDQPKLAEAIASDFDIIESAKKELEDRSAANIRQSIHKKCGDHTFKYRITVLGEPHLASVTLNWNRHDKQSYYIDGPGNVVIVPIVNSAIKSEDGVDI